MYNYSSIGPLMMTIEGAKTTIGGHWVAPIGKRMSGDVLLSHTVPRAVPSAGSEWDRAFPSRYGRRNSIELDRLRVFLPLVPDRNSGTTQWTRNIFEGQALGLLVPVGWALLLYTSGLSTPWSVGGLTT